MSSQYNSSADLPITKSILRAKMRVVRQQLCPYDREAQSLLIVDRLANLLDKLSPRKIGLYLATPLEVNLDSLIERLHRQQIEIYLPHLEDQETPFHQFLSWESLESGSLDLRHPPAESPSLAAALLDVIIVPGLAFDRSGNRLGHGGGWYDRALDFKRAQEKTPFMVGVCLEEQLVKSVPCESFDVRMDVVVTPSLSVSNEQ
ncbi:MAG: 5-formyltetrahydrofolate cyclo-ligase [Abditibacteriaceae bacterium]